VEVAAAEEVAEDVVEEAPHQDREAPATDLLRKSQLVKSVARLVAQLQSVGIAMMKMMITSSQIKSLVQPPLPTA
jgi:hypothetical protein